MEHLICPYCGKDLPNLQTECCGEVGHAVDRRSGERRVSSLPINHVGNREIHDRRVAEYVREA